MKKDILKKFLTGELNYSHTNEDLQAIVVGLAPTKKDRILAIAGSGDQAFALLEFVKEVSIIDVNSIQIEYIQKRIKFLKEKKYGKFLKIDKQGKRDNILQGKLCKKYSKGNLIKRDKYFSKKGRLRIIRNKLSYLKISKKKDILKLLNKKHDFNKIYLSNILRFNHSLGDWDKEAKLLLEKVAKNLPRNGLIYISDHPKQIIIKNLVLDKILTKKSRKFEEINWAPAVYRKL